MVIAVECIAPLVIYLSLKNVELCNHFIDLDSIWII